MSGIGKEKWAEKSVPTSLVYLHGAPIWRPENNNVNIWNLLWLSRWLIICNEQQNIYISTFSNDLTSEKAKNDEIGIHFSTNVMLALCHAPP